MPPLSLTHLKYALAVLPIVVKSTPGISMSMPPSLIGAPVAFLPLPRPQTPSAPAFPLPGGVASGPAPAPATAMADASSAAIPPTVSALRNVIRILLFCGCPWSRWSGASRFSFEYVGHRSAYPKRNL